jgi:peptidyl-dipeptidase A
MAMLMGAITLEPEWYAQLVGTAPEQAEKIGALGAARFRLEELIFARWVMVVVHFERLMYEDPSRDLDGLWWELVEKYQFVQTPAGRDKTPDWATKYHIALAPAYYQNYLLGRMMSLQWSAWLDGQAGGIVGRPQAGEFFRTRIFQPGNTMHWNDALEYATGEKLNPDYFVQKFAR